MKSKIIVETCQLLVYNGKYNINSREVIQWRLNIMNQPKIAGIKQINQLIQKKALQEDHHISHQERIQIQILNSNIDKGLILLKN